MSHKFNFPVLLNSFLITAIFGVLAQTSFAARRIQQILPGIPRSAIVAGQMADYNISILNVGSQLQTVRVRGWGGAGITPNTETASATPIVGDYSFTLGPNEQRLMRWEATSNHDTALPRYITIDVSEDTGALQASGFYHFYQGGVLGLFSLFVNSGRPF